MKITFLFVCFRQRCCALLSLLDKLPTGNLVGNVVDASGGAVPNADVELANVATGVKTAAKTDASGGDKFGNVLVGTYHVTVAAQRSNCGSLAD